LLTRLLEPEARQEITDRGEWPTIDELAQSPRAVPVPVNQGGAGIERVVAQAMLVEDVLPRGSNWQGTTELTIDEKTYHDMIGKQISQ
jgi:hypothetical protein